MVMFKKKTYAKKRFTTGIRNSSYSKVKPSRLKAGYKTYTKSKAVAKRIQPVSELKLKQLRPTNEFAPSPIVTPPGSNSEGVYESNFVFGNGISQWDRFSPLLGFEWPQGTGTQERIGRYMYFRNTMLKLQYQCNQTSSPQITPIRLRCVIFKTRRSHVPSGEIKDPSQSLFLNQEGNEFGTKNLGLRIMDWNTCLTNKRNYIIVKDCSFILQPTLVQPLGSDLMSTSTKYPSMKNININLGHYQKASFNGSTDQPDDANYQYGITTIATAVNGVSQVSNWTMSIRGTTSCYDN